MPVLKHARHERFAQEIAKGTAQGIAYQIAGYKHHDSNASALAKHPDVIERISEIITLGARRAEVTVESICREFEEARCLAAQFKQPSSMVAATMGKAKVAGLLEDITKYVGADGGAIKRSIEVRFVDAPEHEE